MSFLNRATIRHCLDLLKQRFRNRDLSYAEVARHLDVSEVTVKRMLNQDDIQLSRLIALAELAGYELHELLKAAAEENPEAREYNRQQDEAFFRFPHLFQFYMKLRQCDFSADKVQTALDLDEVSTYLYLRALDKLDLIDLQPGNKVRKPEHYLERFPEDSKFIKRGIAWTFEQASEVLLSDSTEHNLQFKTFFLYESYARTLMEELEKVVHRFIKHEIRDIESVSEEEVHQFIQLSYPVSGRMPEFKVPRIQAGDLDLPVDEPVSRKAI